MTLAPGQQAGPIAPRRGSVTNLSVDLESGQIVDVTDGLALPVDAKSRRRSLTGAGPEVPPAPPLKNLCGHSRADMKVLVGEFLHLHSNVALSYAVTIGLIVLDWCVLSKMWGYEAASLQRPLVRGFVLVPLMKKLVTAGPAAVARIAPCPSSCQTLPILGGINVGVVQLCALLFCKRWFDALMIILADWVIYAIKLLTFWYGDDEGARRSPSNTIWDTVWQQYLRIRPFTYGRVHGCNPGHDLQVRGWQLLCECEGVLFVQGSALLCFYFLAEIAEKVFTGSSVWNDQLLIPKLLFNAVDSERMAIPVGVGLGREFADSTAPIAAQYDEERNMGKCLSDEFLWVGFASAVVQDVVAGTVAFLKTNNDFSTAFAHRVFWGRTLLFYACPGLII